MGRPLKKKLFGPNAGGDGFQLVGTAWFEGELAAEPAFIVKQKSSTRYLIEGSSSGKQLEAAPQLGAPAGEGEFQIPVNGTESAKKITANKVVTHEGNVYVWSDVVNATDEPDDAVDADLGTDTDDNDPV